MEAKWGSQCWSEGGLIEEKGMPDLRWPVLMP